MRVQRKGTGFGFSHKIVEATELLRLYKLLEENEFPKLLSPITETGPKSEPSGWEVTIKIRESTNPSEVILDYNRLRNELSIRDVGATYRHIKQLTEKWHKRPFKSRK